MAFEHEGLWHVSFKHRDAPVKWIPLRDPPYYAADTVVAVSPLLTAAEPVTVTSRAVRPGSVEVEIRDENDRPVPRAVAALGTIAFGETTLCGSADERGVVRFDGVPPWNYKVWAHVPASIASSWAAGTSRSPAKSNCATGSRSPPSPSESGPTPICT
jgi:hypothetical protein